MKINDILPQFIKSTKDEHHCAKCGTELASINKTGLCADCRRNKAAAIKKAVVKAASVGGVFLLVSKSKIGKEAVKIGGKFIKYFKG